MTKTILVAFGNFMIDQLVNENQIDLNKNRQVTQADLERFKEQYGIVDAYLEPAASIMIRDNSAAFREFLDSQKVEWKPNGSTTDIFIETTEAFALGKKWESFREKNMPES